MARLRQTLGRFRPHPRRSGPGAPAEEVVEFRLASLEREVQDLKARINGLLLAVVTAVVVEVVLKLVR